MLAECAFQGLAAAWSARAQADGGEEEVRLLALLRQRCEELQYARASRGGQGQLLIGWRGAARFLRRETAVAVGDGLMRFQDVRPSAFFALHGYWWEKSVAPATGSVAFRIVLVSLSVM